MHQGSNEALPAGSANTVLLVQPVHDHVSHTTVDVILLIDPNFLQGRLVKAQDQSEVQPFSDGYQLGLHIQQRLVTCRKYVMVDKPNCHSI